MFLNLTNKEVDIWVTSDTHYGHSNICRGVSKWDLRGSHQSTRDFHTLEGMNNAIVDGINYNVKEDDILIHLGDWSFGGINNILTFRERIKCKNIYLVYGNHDNHIKRNRTLNKTVKAHSLFLNCDHVLDLKANVLDLRENKLIEKNFFCSHYSHRIWDKRHHGRMHLFGHSHGTLNEVTNDRSMDVGIDSVFKIKGDYRPLNINEIYAFLGNRENSPIDHHNSNTN